MFDSSATQVHTAATWVLKGLQPVFGRLPHVDQSCKNSVNPFSWCVCWSGGRIFVVLWGCSCQLMCLKVLLPECSVLFFHHVTSLALLFLPPVEHSPGPWILSLLPRCPPFAPPCPIWLSLRYGPIASDPAPAQGSACTRATSGREGSGGWVCPSMALPVGLDLCVRLCVRP